MSDSKPTLISAKTSLFNSGHSTYPGDDLSEVGIDYPEMRRQAGELIELIESETAAGEH